MLKMALTDNPQPDQSIFSRAYTPWLQAAVVFAAMAVLTIFAKLLGMSGALHVSDRFPWLTAAAFQLFFALFNSIISLTAKNLNNYWGQSIPAFGVLAVGMGALAWLISGIPINEAGSYRWIFIAVTFSYLVFLSLMGFMKKIVDFAQKEEWNHPRMRSRNHKKRR